MGGTAYGSHCSAYLQISKSVITAAVASHLTKIHSYKIIIIIVVIIIITMTIIIIMFMHIWIYSLEVLYELYMPS